jgi:hypothetical protein
MGTFLLQRNRKSGNFKPASFIGLNERREGKLTDAIKL